MSLITYSLENQVGTLTLNDPERLNAMSEAMAKEFKTLVAKLKKEKKLRVLVLTGAGRAFSSGGDLEMLVRMTRQKPSLTQKHLMTFYKSFLCVTDLPCPVIAAINGHAIGAGFCLAIACDLKYASSAAKMGANFVRLGISQGMGGTYSIIRQAGPNHAAEILYAGKIYQAWQIQDFGLVNAVLAPDELLPVVRETAHLIAENSPMAVQKIKAELKVSLHKTREQLFRMDSRAQSLCLAGAEAKEGLQAVKEKRPPRF